jgi:hypothetical protein
MNSAIYTGRVEHRRTQPAERSFAYRHFLLCLDLDELEQVFQGRWLWSVERANLVSFRRSDYLGPRELPLKLAAQQRAASVLGDVPKGRVWLLTQPRCMGLAFNPVSFYWCWDEHDRPAAIVAEITNTPWNERHSYVLDARNGTDGGAHARFHKRFHVSPFLDMEQEYRWSFASPLAGLDVHMQNWKDGRLVFETRLELERKPLDGPGLARLLLAFPGFSLRSLAAIYWQALRLRLAGAPFHEHPKWRTAKDGMPTR